MESQSGQSQFTRLPPVTTHIDTSGGVGRGLLVFLMLYVTMFVVFVIQATSGAGGIGVPGGIWVAVILPLSFLFSSHLGATALGVGEAASLFAIPVVIYYLLPAVLLARGGFILARKRGGPDRTRNVVVGASIVFGYAVGLVLGLVALALLFGPAIAQFSGHLLRLVVVAGIAYPVIFGGLGGYLAFRQKRTY